MKIILRPILTALLLIAAINQYAQTDANLKLWYNKPASQWTEALPIGNGKIGAMIFGRVEEELLQLNESTLWSGGPVKPGINPASPKWLPEIRKALLEDEDYTKANELTKKMQGVYTQSYMPLGDVIIRQNLNGSTPTDYYRDLDLQTAVATTRFTVDGIEYTREMFTSAPDNVMLVRISADKPGYVTLDVSAKSLLHYTLSVQGSNELVVSGKAPAHVDPNYYRDEKRTPVIYEDATGCNGVFGVYIE